MTAVAEATPTIASIAQRRAVATLALEAQAAESLALGPGAALDADGEQFRDVSGGRRVTQRDLTPIQQDRMLQIVWYLYEANPFAQRLVNMMRDLVVGEGVTVTGKDPVVHDWLQRVWTHPFSRFDKNVSEFYLAFSLNGELILPVAVNPIDGMPRFGYLDPMQVQSVKPLEDNVLVADQMQFKGSGGQMIGPTLPIVRMDPATGLFNDGQVFYFRTNTLPNSSRGRSDLLALADWIDLYDQHQFQYLEQLKAAAAYVWDVTVETNDQKVLDDERRKLESAPAGMVYAHNKSKSLDVKTPSVQGSDRAEAAKMLAIHIAGSMGFPITWLGFTDSSNATIQGQNDILLKTPSRRQKEFASVLGTILKYAIEQAVTRNPVLFSGVENFDFTVNMPEIATKDIARVGTVLSSVVSALDTAQQNGTMSRKTAILITSMLVKQLGANVEAGDLEKEIDAEMGRKQDSADAAMATKARNTAQANNLQQDDDIVGVS